LRLAAAPIFLQKGEKAGKKTANLPKNQKKGLAKNEALC